MRNGARFDDQWDVKVEVAFQTEDKSHLSQCCLTYSSPGRTRKRDQ